MYRILTAILLLTAGLGIYWFIRPEIYFFDFINLQNNNPVILQGEIFPALVKNHLADMLWCAAVFIIASYLSYRQYPVVYIYALIALPFVSEVLQGFHVIGGSFDWIDLSIYSLLFVNLFRKFKSMKKISNHFAGIAAVLIFSLAVIASGTSKKNRKPLPPPPPKVYTNGTVRLTEIKDEVFSKPALSEFLKSVKNLSVVLRVPGQVTKVLEEQKYSSNSIYNTIEKEFAKAGYVVRDRALFQQVLENTAVDYSKIKELTGTDLIVEIVGYQKVLYPFNAFTDSAGNEIKVKNLFSVTGIKAEFKIISVKENDFVGSYVFYSTPCVNGCRFVFDENGLYKSATDFFATADRVENFFKDCALRLQKELMPE